jgi:hypothetical protein
VLELARCSQRSRGGHSRTSRRPVARTSLSSFSIVHSGRSVKPHVFCTALAVSTLRAKSVRFCATLRGSGLALERSFGDLRSRRLDQSRSRNGEQIMHPQAQIDATLAAVEVQLVEAGGAVV